MNQQGLLTGEVEYYATQDGSQKLKDINFERAWTGTENTATVYIKNVGAGFIKDLQFKILGNDTQLTVVGPQAIPSGQMRPIVLTWRPPLSLRKVLQAKLKVSGIIEVG